MKEQSKVILIKNMKKIYPPNYKSIQCKIIDHEIHFAFFLEFQKFRMIMGKTNKMNTIRKNYFKMSYLISSYIKNTNNDKF
jgi:hypothetical protein